MKTKRIITIGCLMVNVAFVSAQSWFMDLPIGNDVINPAAYLGCRATSTQSLKLKTIPDLNIDMYTSDIQRFALLPTETYATLGAYTSIIADGHLLICPDVAAFLAGGAPGPYSLQHLAAATNSSFADAYRNWARTGTTYTAGGTMAYMGLKDADKGHTDLAIQLAKRDGATAPDRIRFIFTDALNSSSTSGADSQEGLEGMRLTAVGNDDVNVGIGDFFAAGAGEPTERLDVVTGKVRLRQLPTDPVSTSNQFVTVNPVTGVLERRPVTISALTACEWTLLGAPGSNSNVATAYNTNPGCPQGNRRVGIGTNNPLAKLAVSSFVGEGGPMNGVLVKVLNQGVGASIGIESMVTTDNGSPASQPEAIRGTSLNGTATNTGILGRATMSSATGCDQNQAVIGEATVTNGTVGTNRAGFFSAQGTSAVTTNFGSQNISIGGKHSIGVNATATNTGQDLDAIGVNANTTGNALALYGTRSVAFASGGASVPKAWGGYSQASMASTNYGIEAVAHSGTTNYGVRGLGYGDNAIVNYGINGYAYGDYATNFGVRGKASSQLSSNVCYGVFGEASGPDDLNGMNGHSKWAGYFLGNTFTPGGNWSSSDEQLKQNIEDLPGEVAVAMLQQLAPKTFDFRQDEFGFMHLPTEHQYGLIAQEVEEVLPDLVTTIHQPALLDTAGIEVSPEIVFKAMNYQGLTPLLIAGFQAQQQQINDQQATIDQLRDQINNCCAAQGQGMAPNNGDQRNAPAEELKEQRLLVIPNPVADLTTLRYYVPQAGQVSLQVSSADGKPMETLREEKAEAGEFSYTWNTTQLAAGTYFCTLMVDGNVVVKRAVKVK